MTDERVFSRQDAPPTPGPTGDATTAARDTMLGAEPAATPPPAPAAEAQAPTPDQIREWQQAYENRQSWQAANTQEAQRIAREREELKAIKQWADDLQYGYQNDPRVREFVDGFNKLKGSGQPTEPAGGVPDMEGQRTGQADPALLQRLAAAEDRLEQFERARNDEWAARVMTDAQSEFQKVTGRNWTPQEHRRLLNDCAVTGSIDPKAQMYWTFRNEFAQAGNQQAQQNVAAAQAAAGGAQVEGIAGGEQGQPIDLRTAPDDMLDKMARQAIGAEADADYSPYIWTKPR